jgi:hypothetical protein
MDVPSVFKLPDRPECNLYFGDWVKSLIEPLWFKLLTVLAQESNVPFAAIGRIHRVLQARPCLGGVWNLCTLIAGCAF